MNGAGQGKSTPESVWQRKDKPPCPWEDYDHSGCVRDYFIRSEWDEYDDRMKRIFCDMKWYYEDGVSRLKLCLRKPFYMLPRSAQKRRPPTKSPPKKRKLAEPEPPIEPNEDFYTTHDFDKDGYDGDKHTHCDYCNKFILGFCELHPTSRIPDREPGEDEGVSKRAIRTLPTCLIVKNSDIDGQGIFAKVDLEQNCMFGPYEIRSKENQKYGLETIVDAKDENYSNWMRWVNCARFEEEQNLVAFQYEGRIYYKTFKPIKQNAELLVYYGTDYASELGIEDLPTGMKQKGLVIVDCGNLENMCGMCNIGFPSREHLKKHEQNWHTTKEFACEECDFQTNYRASLTIHVKGIHRKEGHKCPGCDKVFANAGHLQDHVVVHTKEKPFKCSHCDASFTLKSNRDRHEKSIHKCHAFVCGECKKAFNVKVNLDRHMRIHRGEKPYTCTHCDFACNQSFHLQTHIICKHTKAYPHVCTEGCNKGFLTPGELRKHQAKCSALRVLNK